MEFKLFKKRSLTQEEIKKRFYKKIKIDQTVSDKVINHKIFEYVKKNKGLDKVFLTQEQLNDPVFMSALININPEIVKYFKISNELQNNVVFMKHFMRTIVNHNKNFDDNFENVIYEVLKQNDQAVKNVNFIEEIIDLFPGANVLSSVEKVLTEKKILHL